MVLRDYGNYHPGELRRFDMTGNPCIIVNQQLVIDHGMRNGMYHTFTLNGSLLNSAQ